MQPEDFKKGDKVMFLGIHDNDSGALIHAERDSLVVMRIYEVEILPTHKAVLKYNLGLKGCIVNHVSRYFQKVEEPNHAA